MPDNNFFINIDIDKISKRKAHIPNIDKIINKAIDDGIDELVDRLVDKIKDNLDAFGLGDSKLAQTIDIKPMADGISIDMGSGYALFVEFGTGIIGEENPHPNPLMQGWVYDEVGHGESGWWYPTTASDPNKRKYYSKESGTWMGWTRGMPSRPYMYATWFWGTKSANNIINKHINKALKELERSMK